MQFAQISPLRRSVATSKPSIRPGEEAEAPSTTGQDRWVASGAALVLGLAAAGAAVAAPQAQLNRAEGIKALRELNYLEEVARANGGSLSSESTNLVGQVFGYQAEVEPVEALDNLTQGYTLYYSSNAQEEPVAVHSTQELGKLARQVRHQQLESKLDQGDLEGAAKVLGEELGNLLP